MKKYITTDKHPELKEGVKIQCAGNEVYRTKLYTATNLTDSIITDWQTKGYIKELHGPTWTDQDMIDFGGLCRSYNYHADSENKLLEVFKKEQL